jgi:type II secretory pathway pseudopilin PulG
MDCTKGLTTTMGKLSNKSGFTLVEILVSVGIMIIFLPFAASMLTNSQLLASYSKHKIQAAYAAQQLIETQRQNGFLTIAAGHSVIIGPSNIVLDTKGNYNNTNCSTNSTIFCGTAVITVTPTVYTSTTGVNTTSTLANHFVVQVYWSERIFKTFVPITETYAADVLNDPMLN